MDPTQQNQPAPTVVALEDPTLSARVVSSRPLLYDAGADRALDRPAHVRAGSSLAWAGSRLVVVQDDALFVALLDPDGGRVESLALPAADHGVRCFDEGRGNKGAKPDLEACVVIGGTLLALGSGSSPARERVYRVRGIDGHRPDRPGAVDVVQAHSLYARLRAETRFAGSELNIEGAVLLGERLRLFQRGNGAARGDLLAVDATCELDLGQLLRYLDDPATPPPEIRRVVRHELGRVGGVRLGFTDATTLGDDILYLAAAEDSPDAVRDGPVAGVAIGVIPADGRGARWTAVRDQDDSLYTGKAEGLVLEPAHPNTAYLVIDRDDPNIPAELCQVAISGF